MTTTTQTFITVWWVSMRGVYFFGLTPNSVKRRSHENDQLEIYHLSYWMSDRGPKGAWETCWWNPKRLSYCVWVKIEIQTDSDLVSRKWTFLVYRADAGSSRCELLDEFGVNEISLLSSLVMQQMISSSSSSVPSNNIFIGCLSCMMARI